MGQESASQAEEGTSTRKRRPLSRLFLLVLALLAAVALYGWIQREEIARDLITDTLDSYGVEASYRVETIGPDRQVLTDIVIGDPAAPDMTIDRAEVRIRPRFGLPGVSEVVLDNPRLFGTYVDGELSFGALDPLLFTGEEGPFEFPDMVLRLNDGRALIEGDFGPVAARLVGEGHLRGGFAGELAAVAPALQLPGCMGEGATLYGAVEIDAERPVFSGPLRVATLDCEDAGLTIADVGAELDLRVDRTLDGIEGDVSLVAGEGAFGTSQLSALVGEGDFTFREGNLTSSYALEGRDLVTGAATLALLDIEGSLRATGGFERIQLDAEVDGTNVRIGSDVDAALGGIQLAGGGTMIEPLLDRLRRGLSTEMRNSRFTANLTARREDERTSIVIPEARLRGGSGASLLALTRGQFVLPDEGVPLLSGNFATGGSDIPRIAGRMEQGAGGALELRLRMEEYTSGNARVAMPEFRLMQASDGSLRFLGDLRASGPLPGGFAEALALPLDGRVSPSGDIAMWGECTPVRFDSLSFSNLTLGRQSLTLCPPGGRDILRYDRNGLSLAAGAPSLELAGMLGETPIRIASGPVGIAWPGAVSARSLAVALGPPDTATRFVIADLSADTSGEIGGTFDGTDVFLNAVPLDVLQAGGTWRYAPEGRLELSQGRFTLEDREEADRFKPLIARGASLDLFDNQITAEFHLREPMSDQAVTRVSLSHNLNTAAGHADLSVDGVTFRTDGLQPRDLSELAYGVVSLVDGTVTGSGRIDWDAENVTSSGSFSSESLDLAAAFGPVQGARGTVVFTDLLGLTTAPGQRIFVDTVNPGIEVYEGVIDFSLTEGTLLQLERARWPFLGGLLTMQPVTMTIGVEEERRYVFQIEGLEASRFIERMELNNLSATGVFDGNIPIVFDAEGVGRIENGRLSGRPPGGNLSYVGQLTYEDLSYIGNFAFNTLRDLQYDEMDIVMNGPLTGEVVTQVRFDGIRQGETAETNILTRQIAKLPIQLRVNIRAPFYQLIRTMSSLYDPAAVRDPRGLGLLRNDGTVLQEQTNQESVDALDAAAEAEQSELENESDIQPPESEATP